MTPQEYHQETLNNLRIAQRNARKLCCTMLDTMGPEIIVINRCAPVRAAAAATAPRS